MKENSKKICNAEIFGDKGLLFINEHGLLTYYDANNCPLITRSHNWQKVLRKQFKNQIESAGVKLAVLKGNEKELPGQSKTADESCCDECEDEVKDEVKPDGSASRSRSFFDRLVFADEDEDEGDE